MTIEEMDEKIREFEYELNEIYINNNNREDTKQKLIELCEEIVKWCEDND